MGRERKLPGFFRQGRDGLEIRGARRPGVVVPEAWHMEYFFLRLIKGGLGVTLRDLNDWRYSWSEIWQLVDMLDLSDWIEWQQHAAAEETRNR